MKTLVSGPRLPLSERRLGAAERSAGAGGKEHKSAVMLMQCFRNLIRR